MTNNVKKAIDALQTNDLIYMQRDLFNGGSKLRAMVTDKIREIAEAEKSVCATCGNVIEIEKAENFSLTFGPPDMKKKAFFCATDCIEYFLVNVKKIDAKKTKTQKVLE